MTAADALELRALVHLPTGLRPALAVGFGMLLLAVATVTPPAETALTPPGW